MEYLGYHDQEEEEERFSELLHSQAHIWNQTFNFVNSALLKCAVELGIPDAIHRHGEPMTIDQLVAVLPINQAKARYVYRLMRVLVHSGFFLQQKLGEHDGYMLTLVSQLLLKDEPLSSRAFLLTCLDPIMTNTWHSLKDWFQNNDPTAFDTTHGKNFWEYLVDVLRLGNSFNEAMASDSRLITKVLIKESKGVFEGWESLVDVGGGTGTMSRAIAKTFPNMKCIVYDLPQVISGLEGTENLQFVGEDMFQVIPSANAVLLKWILHNWNDEECVNILKKCKGAISSKENGGKVIIIDMNIEKQKTNYESVESQLSFEMVMMVLFIGKERNEKEWANLFSAAGFSHYKITPILGLRSLIEAYP